VVGVRRGAVNCGDGCGVCDVQRGGIVETAGAGGYVEQCVVSAIGVCRDQLYEELGLCLFCGGGVVGGGLCVDDVAGKGQGKRLTHTQVTGKVVAGGF
jgi:hypothetical protein